MVFEKIVVDVLNRFLSDYIEGLDTSQLKLGIWGGDAVFTNLKLKTSALNELELPIETVYGLLGKMILKIPWKNLYQEPVVVLVEQLFIIAEPNLEVKYNPETENKKLQDEKQRLLDEFENNRRLREEGPNAQPIQDSFTDKLVTQILKNVQIKISNIHIRYEDKVTNPENPFALGLTMHTLNFNTADGVENKPPWQIFKIMNLECLGLYWNCECVRMCDFTNERKAEALENTIARRGFHPSMFNYVFGPLYLVANLSASQKPENDDPPFSIPVMKINLDMQRLDIQLLKQQFQDLMLLNETMDRMNRGLPYRKYRPFLQQYSGHAKEWWHFAYECIINEQIRRVKKNWDWSHIKGHRQVYKLYSKAFKEKVKKKGRVNEETEGEIEFCEDYLDSFNIILVRKQVYFELELEEQQKKTTAKPKSWITRWWSGSDTDTNQTENIREQFYKAIDAAEKRKLYDAMGLDTDEVPGPYPETYTDYVMNFLLGTIQIVLANDKNERITELIVKSSRLQILNRSKFSGLRIEFTLKDLTMFGKKQKTYLPVLVEPKGDFSMLLDILYEVAPLDKTCDERFHFMANPLQILYDNATVESIVDIFTIASDDETVRALADLNARTKLMNMKEMSSLGLQYALTTHSFFECKVNILAPYIIIPFAGLNVNPRSTLVIDLGRLVVVTEPRSAARDVKSMHDEGLDEEQIFANLVASSYDSFITNLTEVQILLVLKKENLSTKESSQITNQHIIQPMTLKITIKKCLIADDPRLPAMKISGVLSSVQINFSDTRIVEMTALANSFQQTDPAKQSEAVVMSKSSDTIDQRKSYMATPVQAKRKAEKEGTTMRAQLVSLALDFRFGELAVNLHKTVQATLTLKSDNFEYSNKFISFTVREFILKITQKTYDLSCDVGVGGVELVHYRSPENVNIINTYKSFKQFEKLFTISYVQVDEISPFFRTDYESTKQKVILDFHILNLYLNQQSLTEIITEWQRLQKRLEDITALYTTAKPELAAKTSVGSRTTSQEYPTSKSEATVLSKVFDYKKQYAMIHEPIELKVTARIDELGLQLTSDKKKIANFALVGMALGISNKKSYKRVTIRLKDIQLLDMNTQTIHKTIVEVVDGIALHCIIILYDLKRAANFNKNDMSIVANIGCVKIVYLNWFVTTITEFANSFQTAQQMIRDTAAEAADVVMEQMTVIQHTTRVQINLHIKAPILVVPISSNSYHVFIFDFGYITIINKFANLKVENLEESRVIIDEISLQLEDLQMSRASLSKALFVEREQTLLRPTTFSMTIKRNLSTHWFNKVPDIDVYGKIKSIQILLSQSDYAMAMQVKAQNFAEGLTSLPAKEMNRHSARFGSSDWRLSKHSVDIMRRNSRASSIIQTIENIETKEKKEQQVYLSTNTNVADLSVSLRFQFTMDVLTVDLFTGGTQFQTARSKRFPRKGLARFSLLVLSLKGRQFNDGSMSINLLLCDCILDDTRSYRLNKISRYVQRSARTKQSTITSTTYRPLKSMLDLAYTSTTHDTFVAVRVFSMNFILSMDYMTTVADFFTVSDEDLDESKAQKVVGDNDVSGYRSRVSVENMRESTEDSDSEATMTVDLRLEQPDIILVESMDEIDCKCIIMNTELLLRYRYVREQTMLTGSMKNVHIYNCIFNEDRRGETMNTILKPCSLNFFGSSPSYEGLHIDICVTDISINVSPAVLDLFNKIVETMNKEGFIEKMEEVQDYSKMWRPYNFNDSDYWFLKQEESEAAYGKEDNEDDPIVEQIFIIDSSPVQELCSLFIPAITLCLEAGGIGKYTPLLLVEIKYEASCHNWSSQMQVYSDMWIKMAYFNMSHEVWESIVEPMENIINEVTVYTPWQLKLDLENKLIVDKDDVHQTRKISVTSQNNLEITVSKSFLDVLNVIQRSFDITETIQEVGDQETNVNSNFPYEIRNDSGFEITLKLSDGPFASCGKINYHQIVLGNGAQAYLQLKDPSSMKDIISVNDLPLPQVKEQFFLDLVIDYQKTKLSIPVNRADKRYFVLPREGPASEPWALISDIQVHENVTTLTFRSIIQICNHLMTNVNIYYVKRYTGAVTLIGTVEEDSCINLPIQAVHASTGELYFSVQGYAKSSTSYSCNDLQEAGTLEALLRCRMEDTEEDVAFFIKVVGKVHNIYHELTSRHTSKSVYYVLRLKSSALFCNSLPVSMKVKLYSIETLLDPGELLQMPHVEPGKCSVTLKVNYLDKNWICYHDIPDVEGLAVWTFESYDSAGLLELNLGVHSIYKKGTFTITIYCPYWMINNTGLNLAYMKSKRTESLELRGVQRNYMETPNVLYHPEFFKGPLMFSFHAKNFFAKKTARIRVELGEWSCEFPLDTPGSGGSIECNSDNMTYEIGITNTLTYNNLTKQIMFTPRFLLVNQSDHLFHIQEVEVPDAPWIQIVSKSVLPFWPNSKKVAKAFRAKCGFEEDVTLPVAYNLPLTVLLRLDNNFGGIQVEVQVFDSSVYIMFQVYKPGMAPALVINHTDEELQTRDIAAQNFRSVGPFQRMFFTWDNPSSHKKFCAYLKNRRIMQHDLRRDGTGKFKVKSKQFIYWSSFLYDMQRIVLFTQSKSIAQNSLIVKEDLIMDQIIVSIYGIGFSLVDNQKLLDIMYMRFESSGILWEISKLKSKRFKPLPAEDMRCIEQAYVKYLTEVDVPGKFPNPRVEIKPNLEVDFKTNLLLKPTQKKLQRSFRPGFWVQLNTSKNEMHLHCKINHIQMDNQMREYAFPVVLAVVRKQKTIVNVEEKPFLELSIVKRLVPHSSLQQYKYFKLLIQEFHVKLDIPFINALLGIFEAEDTSEEEAAILFTEDLKLVDKELWELLESGTQKEAKNFYDLLHFSPLKIHISFSLAAMDAPPTIITVLLQGIGVTLTEMHDVVLRLGFFERTYCMLSNNQLIGQAMSHYTSQAVKQAYVLMLGLDVLGNPFGLMVGYTKGFGDLFYEPLRGAIQGPNEFAEGLYLGVRSLFGHTVGGTFGAVSKITGAMGKGIAALTFDHEYQQRRRKLMSKPPVNLSQNLIRCGKGLVMGVVDGVTGVFTKPIQGARQEGLKGFVKGIGKGAIGLVAKPTTGLIDFAADTFDAVKRATDLEDESSRVRPSRFMHPDGLLRPYCSKSAEGSRLLQDAEKGRYSKDLYEGHVWIIKGKQILMLTDQRILILDKGDVFGTWRTLWTQLWTDVQSVEQLGAESLQVYGGGEKLLTVPSPLIYDFRMKMERLRKEAKYTSDL